MMSRSVVCPLPSGVAGASQGGVSNEIQDLKQRRDLISQEILDQSRLKQSELTTKNKRETIYVAA